ncbi:MAG: hypothetical protein AAFS10_01900, partial [Myxococcota bacterium]
MRYAPLTLKGLRLGPSQVLGAIRLVPLLRERNVSGLRLLQGMAVDGSPLGGPFSDQSMVYVPHGLLMPWSDGHTRTWMAADGTLFGPRSNIRHLSGGDLVHHAPPGGRRYGAPVAMLPMQEALD